MRSASSPPQLRLLIFAALLAALASLPGGLLRGHDVITSTVSFNRDLLPIFQARCIGCHRSGGEAFSLETYADARPWAKAIEEEVLRRRMPPWGAAPGFGDFQNDPSLTMTEMQRIAEWAEGGAPEGDAAEPEVVAGSAADRPVAAATPASRKQPPLVAPPLFRQKRDISAEVKLRRAFSLEALQVISMPERSSFQLIAELPGGARLPLIWITGPAAQQVFHYRRPVALPAGAVIRGLPAGASVRLLSGMARRPKARRR